MIRIASTASALMLIMPVVAPSGGSALQVQPVEASLVPSSNVTTRVENVRMADDGARRTSAGAALAPYSYADLVDLAAPADLVVVAKVRRVSRLDTDRTGPVRPGWARIYVEADTLRLLAGTVPIGQNLRYLADVPLTAKGRLPVLKNRSVVLFAQPVRNRPAQLQLVAPDAQVFADEVDEAQLRALLTELVDPASLPAISGVRDILHTPGNLAGEGETQIFLMTQGDEAASITVRHRPGQEREWGVSAGELVDPAARPPQPQTLAWYRLACALPAELPVTAQISDDPGLQAIASNDYALVVRQLGPCVRHRTS
ncbi:hypothetical protein RM533_11230 [Croceicoccus sp. F390]|uniref:Uncharacterized protein n=1 Tax=Croceicoccus esteveae TaxID=3075597 RepID=A0ABU2ZJH6_9SPHN|nr:hypothetical protein [Croceicoccus sp. F390]MDT0576748.1 hypothetical protein [Croceicoccus sp. F390]